MIVLEDCDRGDSEVPAERFPRPNAADVGQEALSPSSVDRRSLFMKGTTSDTLVRGRSVSPNRQNSEAQGPRSFERSAEIHGHVQEHAESRAEQMHRALYTFKYY